ncbi:hypothetical protein ACFX5Q_15265 [Mesorhizobium sp. IMUNJ 23033]|uniref:hypothetical protein n=1 Tax=Mesorhizobium sp. IMUNJ 23033 TaxID=3378039 RepID=UPI00384B50F6
MQVQREMQRQNGYWWAISLHQEDDGLPEIIDVHGQEAARMGDDWPYHIGEFDMLQHVDTSGWPQKGKLTEEELLDPDYAVDPATVHEGYWWAIHSEDFQPLIVRVGKDAVVYRLDCEDDLNNFEFLMPIDTSGWPKE